MSLWEYGVDWRRLRETIIIDSQDGYQLGDDSCFLNYPECVPTVFFDLFSTAELCRIADRIRMKEGYEPILGADRDSSGWYNFGIGINSFTESKLDTSIVFVVVNSDSKDNEQAYEIDLCPLEQDLIYGILNEQTRAWFGKSCDELLEEARQAMEADM